MCIDNFFKNLFQLFLSYMEINFQKQFISFYFTVYKSQILWNDLIKHETSDCRFYRSCLHCSICHLLGYTYFYT